MTAVASNGLPAGTMPPKEGRPLRAYTRAQVALHWLVAALVLEQYATSGAIVRTHSMHMIGMRQDPTDLLLHVLHNRLGLLLTGLMAVRLVLRIWMGAPARTRPKHWTGTASSLVHHAFYAVLIAEGMAGAVASYLWWPASILHVALFKALLGLLALHLAAAFWHALVLRDGVLGRMVPPWGRAGQGAPPEGNDPNGSRPQGAGK